METPQPRKSSKSISILCLGDSYTKGEGIDLSLSFPYQLKDSIIQSGYAVSELKVIAQTGWTTNNLIQAVSNASISNSYDIVTLLIGVNNQYQGRSIDEYESEFIQLATEAIEYARGDKSNVLIISIPDYGYTPFGSNNQPAISNAIDLFNSSNKRLADSLGLTYTDITPITRLGLQQPNLVAGDNLHPSGLCYSLWLNQFLPILKMKLQ
ncbi:MAG: SGNH/GDSL hydrolase family protein [Cytophagaceae bacterium]